MATKGTEALDAVTKLADERDSLMFTLESLLCAMDLWVQAPVVLPQEIKNTLSLAVTRCRQKGIELPRSLEKWS